MEEKDNVMIKKETKERRVRARGIEEKEERKGEDGKEGSRGRGKGGGQARVGTLDVRNAADKIFTPSILSVS